MARNLCPLEAGSWGPTPISGVSALADSAASQDCIARAMLESPPRNNVVSFISEAFLRALRTLLSRALLALSLDKMESVPGGGQLSFYNRTFGNWKCELGGRPPHDQTIVTQT